ncbi:MAG: hypothetical protein UT43_C0012G0005 [Parcubacteria group bacterium GW2011_GWC1_39_29]|nr:MAG: hypothetical protein UT43_C0012G0005 [Parcubacteria group bacterium GW2011_GWC1_39_29]
MAEGSREFQQEEIAQLERQLQEKRAALGQSSGPDKEEAPLQREMVHEMVKEKIQEHISSYQPLSVSNSQKIASSQTNGHTPSYTLPEFKDLVQNLINMVFNSSISEAIKEVGKTNNMALIDAFHDALTDELYNTLIERKKLEAVK